MKNISVGWIIFLFVISSSIFVLGIVGLNGSEVIANYLVAHNFSNSVMGVLKLANYMVLWVSGAIFLGTFLSLSRYINFEDNGAPITSISPGSYTIMASYQESPRGKYILLLLRKIVGKKPYFEPIKFYSLPIRMIFPDGLIFNPTIEHGVVNSMVDNLVGKELFVDREDNRIYCSVLTRDDNQGQMTPLPAKVD